MRAAVIDIGSNSTKLVIGEDCNGEIKILESLKNVIDLGKNTFYYGRISQDIINELIQLLFKYQETIKAYEVSEVKVIATTAVREAENKDIFLDTVKRKTGFDIDVLNVGDVVYYINAFLSHKLKMAYPIHEKNLLIVELGAGSLDVSVMEKGYTLMNLGIPAGTLRLKQFKNRIDGSQKETFAAVSEYIENNILSLKNSYHGIKIDDLILIDESYTASLKKILPNKKRESNFFKFRLREAKQFLNLITEHNLDALLKQYQLPQDIADTIDGYAIILHSLFKLIKQHTIYVLETSLSEALLAHIIFNVELARKYNKANQLTSVARFLCRKFGTDLRHTRHVANLAEELFNHLKATLGLKDDDLLYLTLAAYLHNIGSFISNRAHHKHSEYIINALNLFRLTDEEIRIIACIARYHRKATPQRTHYIYGSLPPNQQILVQKLSSLIRIANALDSSHKQKVKKMEIKFNGSQDIHLTVFTQDSFALEKSIFADIKDLFEEVSGNKIHLMIRKYG